MTVQDALATVSDGDQLNDGYFNDLKDHAYEGSLVALKNHARQLIDRAGVYSADGSDLWGEAYSSAGGRNTSVASATADFDTNKYKVGTSPYVVIEATSISSTGDFAINNCVIGSVSSGVWILSCTTGTDAVKRAQIYKTLFYGTDGSDPRASATYITGITALKTSVTRDVGKQGYLALITASASAPNGGTVTGSGTLDITFNDTADNADCSSWSRMAIGVGAYGSASASWALPVGTTLNSASGTSSATSDEFGTDREADEYANPANARLTASATESITAGNNTGVANLVLLYHGSLSITPTIVNPTYTTVTVTETDFYTDSGIPAFTSSSDYDNIIAHTIPSGTFSSTVSKAIMGTILPEWETGANIQFKLTNAGEDSGWLEADDVVQSFTAFTSEPTTCIVKLIPKSSSPTAGYPSIRGFAMRLTD